MSSPATFRPTTVSQRPSSGAGWPIPTEKRRTPGWSPACRVTILMPASVATVRVGPGSTPLSMTAWARHRMPLPLISARPPSAFQSSITRSTSPAPGVPRIRPSAPTPRWRWHTWRTRSPSTGCERSASRSTRKSFPRAWYFSRRIVTMTSFPAAWAVGREDPRRRPAR